MLERFEIQPVVRSALPEVGDFLHTWRSGETVSSIERRLQWLLIDNPAASADATLGYCIRDGMGSMKGLSLQFPVAFLAGDQRLLGLCSGSFFVAPEARSLGFYLFKKYLRTSGHSFYFASTCNTASSELWKSMGGCPVPHSETEYIVPLRLDALLPAYVAARTSSQAAVGIARLCGRGANPILQFLTRPSARLIVEPCQDWEKLSDLFHRHRPSNYITSDRSAAFLEWRYGPNSPSHPCGVYLFRCGRGNEGWFALGHSTSGEGGRLREAILLDVVWPREEIAYGLIFQEILRIAAESADALFFRWQPGLNYREYSRCVIPHKLGAPRAFVRVPKGAPRFPLGTLDYDDSDSIAWRFQWRD
jgi:hypothetical protein